MSQKVDATRAVHERDGSELLGVKIIEVDFERPSRQSVLVSTNSIKCSDVVGCIDELHHLLGIGTGVEVHVFAFFLQITFLELFASRQSRMSSASWDHLDHGCVRVALYESCRE